jgi:diguanylate cyclase (GGDEF)-like protein
VARILVVGKDPWRADVAVSLRAAGHEVVSASDAFEATETALATPTAAIVTQRTLISASGFQLCRLVHAERPLRAIPVIVMSGEGDVGAGFQARAAGAAAHVVDIEQLMHVLPGVLARAELETTSKRVDRELLASRLSIVLDRALLDAEIAADVRALATVDSLERMFEGLVELASQVLPYAWLGLVVSGETPSFRLQAAEGDETAEAEAREALGLDADTPCIDARHMAARGPSTPRARHATEVPIFFGDCQVGQLAVMLPPATSGDVKRAVGLIAYELGGALKIMSLLEQVQRQAATDALTGLLNRRAFLDLVGREQARAARYGTPTSFLVVDIDHFKNVNDVHGHPAGDAVLRGIARTFEAATRTTDIVCRWGGEEFVVALPHTNGEDALLAAERIRARIEATAHELPGGGSLYVTASIGVATAASSWSSEQMLGAADAALYEAKATGRNCVCLAGSVKRPAPRALCA